jgi:hypothetical protein
VEALPRRRRVAAARQPRPAWDGRSPAAAGVGEHARRGPAAAAAARRRPRGRARLQPTAAAAAAAAAGRRRRSQAKAAGQRRGSVSCG